MCSKPFEWLVNNLGIVICRYIALRSNDSDRNYSDKWKKKFADNKQRDQRVLSKLKEEGWRVAIIWECTTRSKNELGDVIKRLDKFIQNDGSLLFETDYRES